MSFPTTAQREAARGMRALPLAAATALLLLVAAVGVAPTSAATAQRQTGVAPGATVPLAQRTQTSACTLGTLPDRACSPGAYSTNLTRAVICAPGFRTSDYRNVPTGEKHQVEQEYGLAPRSFGASLEIDHIVSLELGGSNDPVNLFPELASPHPGYHAKDKLENRLHQLVCSGKLALASAQQQIAADWTALYTRVFGAAPTG
jgi:hypothetical protein